MRILITGNSGSGKSTLGEIRCGQENQYGNYWQKMSPELIHFVAWENRS